MCHINDRDACYNGPGMNGARFTCCLAAQLGFLPRFYKEANIGETAFVALFPYGRLAVVMLAAMSF